MNIKNLFRNDLGERKPSLFIYVLLIVLYVVMAQMTAVVAQSNNTIKIGPQVIPVSAIAGILSSVALMSLVFMVVFYSKLGFYTAMVIYVFRIAHLIYAIFSTHTLPSIPGLFTSLVTLISIILIYLRNRKILQYRKAETEHLKEQRKFSQRLFEQTATALVNAIDAKDVYSHGHSLRVAEYSKKIAEIAGKDEEECRKIYFTALLHDVGKIGIDESIINKSGKLTPEEYETIKQHTVMGNQILAGISEYPYLSIGAFFHHERYDGKGYPVRLKGDDIPEIARIISVADAYDAMSSNRSYRSAIPQQIVREEIVKGSGTQFDPKFARIMQHLIDLDEEYEMKERDSASELDTRKELYCEQYRDTISDGILLNPYMSRISFKYRVLKNAIVNRKGPTFIIFDSLDGREHDEPDTIRDMNYFEYCVINAEDGKVESKGIRKYETKLIGNPQKTKNASDEIYYSIEALKQKDHVLLRISDGTVNREITLALPDSSRYAYLGITGEYCIISGLSVEKSETMADEGYITRIADEISFIDGPEGNIPNIQIDGHLTDSTIGIPVADGLKISFHTRSLPTARLIWHCPYIDVFSSKDKKIKGEAFKDYALIRLDGEIWESGEWAENRFIANRTDDFIGWEEWKKANKDGFDVTVSYTRKDNVVTVTTENQGLYIKNITTVFDPTEEVYTAITGDQCAITNIHITAPALS